MKTLINGRIVTDGKILDGYDIITDNGKIIAVQLHGEVLGEVIDLGSNYISAGFIDIHCHGGGGAEFIDAAPEAFETAAAVHAKHGTRVLFPTISATDFAYHRCIIYPSINISSKEFHLASTPLLILLFLNLQS